MPPHEHQHTRSEVCVWGMWACQSNMKHNNLYVQKKSSVFCLCFAPVNAHAVRSNIPRVKDTNIKFWANALLLKHWVTSPNRRPQRGTTTFFSVLLKAGVKPFWLEPSCLSWIMSSTKQNPQNMQPLPRGHWVAAWILYFFFCKRPPQYISLFYGLVVYRETSYQSHIGLCCKKDRRRQSRWPVSEVLFFVLRNRDRGRM